MADSDQYSTENRRTSELRMQQLLKQLRIKASIHQVIERGDLWEEKDKEVQKFPLNRGDNKPRRCEQHF